MSDTRNCAESMDLMNIRIAVGLLLVSCAYALEASVYLVPTNLASAVDQVSLVFGLLGMVVILWAIGPSIWRKFKRRSLSIQEPESFITQAFNQALNKSWIITFISLVLLKSLDNLLSQANLPLDFFLKALIFLMMFSASVVFLVLIRTDENETGIN